MLANITVVNTASFVIQGNINDTVWNVGQLAELKVTIYSNASYTTCVVVMRLWSTS